MSPVDPAQLRRVFDTASALDEAMREGFVRAECGADERLCREVLKLLQSMESDWSSQMDTAAGSFTVDGPSNTPAVLPAATIGGFRLLGIIGRGAMGSVYEAEQEAPRRRVALKVMHAWHAGPLQRRRLLAEADILARLDNPGIARVIAAGTHELPMDDAGPLVRDLLGGPAAVPWVAMELVESGQTLEEFAGTHGLDLQQRIRLFVAVCDAVSYGHSQGVIHRDLKPANVLVTPQGQPKVIDFGVARALRQDTEQPTQATEDSSVVGTLRYMSPEQCDGRAQRADTRSDVYALGVMLYELLTGQPPYQLDKDSLSASARTISQIPPRRPREVTISIPRDVETIILKALRKEPEARYQSASDLGDDLRRAMECQPVMARKPTLVYAAGMWMRRHPARAMLALLAGIGMLCGILGVSIGLAREKAARGFADRQARLANLVAADYAVRLGDGGIASARLEAVPPPLRGWEWQLLHAMADTSESVRELSHIVPEGGAVHITPKSDVVLVLESDSVRGVQIPEAVTLWTVACSPSLSATHYARDQRTALVFGATESLLIDLDSGMIRQRFTHPGKNLAFGGVIDPAARFVGITGPGFVATFSIASGEMIQQWPVEGSVYGADTDPAGNQLAWSDAQDIVVVRTSDWADVVRIPSTRPTIWEPSLVAWSSDGSVLACTTGKDVQLVDVGNPSVMRSLTGATQRIESVAFTPDSRTLLCGSRDTTVRAWDVASGQLIGTHVGHRANVHMVLPSTRTGVGYSFSSLDSECAIRRWDSTRPAAVRSLNASAGIGGGFVAGARMDPAADRVVCATIGGGIEAFRIGCDENEVAGPIERYEVAVLSPDGSRAIGRIAAGAVRALDVKSRQQLWQRDDWPAVTAGDIAPGNQIAAVGAVDGAIRLLRMTDGAELQMLSNGGSEILRVGFSPSGTKIAVARKSGSLEIVEVESGRVLLDIQGSPRNAPAVFAWSPDGQFLAHAPAGDTGEVRLIDVASGRNQTHLAAIRSFIWSLAFSPDGSRLAVGSQDRRVRVFDTATGDELLTLRDHLGSVMSLWWTKDGRALLSGGHDRKVFVYQIPELTR